MLTFNQNNCLQFFFLRVQRFCLQIHVMNSSLNFNTIQFNRQSVSIHCKTSLGTINKTQSSSPAEPMSIYSWSTLSIICIDVSLLKLNNSQIKHLTDSINIQIFLKMSNLNNKKQFVQTRTGCSSVLWCSSGDSCGLPWTLTDKYSNTMKPSVSCTCQPDLWSAQCPQLLLGSDLAWLTRYILRRPGFTSPVISL